MPFTIVSIHGVVGVTGAAIAAGTRRRWVLLPGPAFAQTWTTLEEFSRIGGEAFPLEEHVSKATLTRRAMELARAPHRAEALRRASDQARALNLAVLDVDGRPMPGRVNIVELPSAGSPQGDIFTAGVGGDLRSLGFEGPPPHYFVALVEDVQVAPGR
ncbi:MAG: hypothetical protein H0X64_04660 [Gemmatimonadaceae bacterium]|nr:hypothetical protein [Gemmatimonadaceae bacterium]